MFQIVFFIYGYRDALLIVRNRTETISQFLEVSLIGSHRPGMIPKKRLPETRIFRNIHRRFIEKSHF